MKPLFNTNQRVVYVNRKPFDSSGLYPNPLTEDKVYYIANPDRHRDNGKIYVSLSGVRINAAFDQNDFIPYEDNLSLEDEIFESLKGKCEIKNVN